MKKDQKKIGILQFGTEVVSSADGTMTGLLGASPGASIAVQIAIDVLTKCFPHKLDQWRPKLQEMIPTYGTNMNDDQRVMNEVMSHNARILGINV